MTRWIITAVAVGVITALSAAPGCASTGVGDPCIPDEEYDPTFQAFSINDVNVESKSYVCLTRLCLVNHFQGRVSCPYGQSAEGTGTAGPAGSIADTVYHSEHGCTIPGGQPGTDTVSATNKSVAPGTDAVPAPASADGTGWVPAQIPGSSNGDRTANKTVYCSCRCANVNGNTNDNGVYCSCPQGFTCTPLVTSIGAGDEGLTGSYCVMNNTDYEASQVNTAIGCLPTTTDVKAASYCDQQY
jgi:hypothetical protein